MFFDDLWHWWGWPVSSRWSCDLMFFDDLWHYKTYVDDQADGCDLMYFDDLWHFHADDAGATIVVI